MRSNLDTVLNLFESQNQQWISSKGVHDQLPSLKLQEVYASVSELARTGVLEKRRLATGSGFEYKITPEESRSGKQMEVRRMQRAKMLDSSQQENVDDAQSEANQNVDNQLPQESDSSAAVEEGRLNQANSDENGKTTDEVVNTEIQFAQTDSEAEQLSLLDDSKSDVSVTQVPAGVKGRSPRVVWTSEEKYAIAKEVVRLQKAQPHLSIMTAVRQAQQILPEKRQRLAQIQNRHHIPWIDDLIAQVRNEEPVDNPNRAVDTNEDRDATTTSAQPEEEQKAPTPVDVPASPSLFAEFASTSEIMDILMQRLGQTFKTMLLEVLSSDEMREILSGVRSPTAAEQSAAAVLTPARPGPATAHSQAFAPSAPTPLSALQSPSAEPYPAVTRQRMPEPSKATAKIDSPRLKRVLIMGLIPNQIQEVTNEFKGALDLRFWRTDQSANLLKSLSKQVDQTVIMTDFIAHSHEVLIKNASVPYVRQSGGISRLKDTLTHIYANDDV